MKSIRLVIIGQVLLITALFAFWWVSSASDKGQAILNDYGRRPANKEQAVKFHLALKLLTGHWNDSQKQTILKSINNPTKDLASEIAANFSPSDGAPVFFNLGSEDISDLRTVYAIPFGKGEMVRDWTPEREARMWQQNFALGFVRYDLSLDQQQFLVDYAEKLPEIFAEDRESAQKQVNSLDAEAATKFSRTIGRGLFATAGKDTCKPDGLMASVKEYFSPTCVCSTATYNWSCNDSCHAATCTTDPQNCGPLWLWDCIAMCNNGDMEIQ